MPGEEEVKQQAPQAKPKSRLIIWICIGLAFVAIVAVFVRFLFFQPVRDPLSGTGVTAPSTVITEPGEIIELGDFLTNLSRPDEETYISVRVAVELDARPGSREATQLSAELKSRSLELKQVVEEVLRSRNREDLATETGLEGMRQEILRKTNARLQRGKVRKVLTYNLLFS